MNKTPAWVGITYLIYCTVLLTIVMGGTMYAVFVLGHSGWWIFGGLIICGCGYRPAVWNGVFTGIDLRETRK